MSAPDIPPHDKVETQAPFDWRAHIKVHPAAQLFPPLSEAELDELAEDIEKNGLRVPIVSWSSTEGGEEELLEGRSRMDALALKDLLYETEGHLHVRSWTGTRWAELSGNKIQFQHLVGGDPYAIALSFNVHRRHLTPEDKRELIAKLVKAKPELSDRQLGKLAKSSKNTVASVRTNLESRGQVDHVEKRKDTKGRKQPAKKSPKGDLADALMAGIGALAKRATAIGDQLAQMDMAEEASPVSADTPPTDTKLGHKGVKAKDTALIEFTDRVLDLKRRISNHKPERFAKAAVGADDLSKLGRFLIDLAELLKADGAQ